MISSEIKGRDKESGVIVIECYHGVFTIAYTFWIFCGNGCIDISICMKDHAGNETKVLEEIEKTWHKKFTEKITIPVTEI